MVMSWGSFHFNTISLRASKEVKEKACLRGPDKFKLGGCQTLQRGELYFKVLLLPSSGPMCISMPAHVIRSLRDSFLTGLFATFVILGSSLQRRWVIILSVWIFIQLSLCKIHKGWCKIQPGTLIVMMSPLKWTSLPWCQSLVRGSSFWNLSFSVWRSPCCFLEHRMKLRYKHLLTSSIQWKSGICPKPGAKTGCPVITVTSQRPYY